MEQKIQLGIMVRTHTGGKMTKHKMKEYIKNKIGYPGSSIIERIHGINQAVDIIYELVLNKGIKLTKAPHEMTIEEKIKKWKNT